MKQYGELVLGIILGAGVMYLMDPERGRRRRALIVDQFNHGLHEAGDAGERMRAKARHLRNRARGRSIEARQRFGHEDVIDSVLEARVRSALGRLLEDASTVQVRAEHGRVTLSGTLSGEEMGTLVDSVQNIAGVHDVINRMSTSEKAG